MNLALLGLGLATPVIIATASLLVVYAIRYIDVIEREPKSIILAGMLAGFLSVIPSIIAQLFLMVILRALGMQELQADHINTILGAPISEEVFKGLSVLFFAFIFRKELDSLMDFLVYACAVGTGFELIENLLYQAGTFFQEDVFASWFNMINYRVISGGGSHAFFSVWIGLSCWLLLRVKRKGASLLSICFVLVAALLHSLNNYAAVLTELDPNRVITVNHIGQGLYATSNGIDVALFIGLIGYAVVRDLHYLGDFGLDISGRIGNNTAKVSQIKQLMDPMNHLLAYSDWTWTIRMSRGGAEAACHREKIRQFGKLALKYGEIGVRYGSFASQERAHILTEGIGLMETNTIPA